MKNGLYFGRIRVQFLSDKLVRVEYDKKSKFEDRDTFFIPDRSRSSGFDGYTISETVDRYVVRFSDYKLYIPKNAKSLRGVKLTVNEKTAYRYAPAFNGGELPALDKTPQVYALSDRPRIVVPEGGYTYRGKRKNSGYEIDENAQDIYLLLCGKNAKTLRKLYVDLTGKSDMVRLATLGLWNSRYYPWSQKEAQEMLRAYERHGVPLDNMVIDVDWRAEPLTSANYGVNKALFPRMKAFFNCAHKKGVEITFNDHPIPVVKGSHVLNPAEVKYREKNLQAFLEMGLDNWWYDRNWSTRIISPTKKLNYETLGMYLFHDITKHYFQKQAGDERVYRREVAMSNTDNIINGAYEEIKNSASHRYPLQWTGDIYSDERSLQMEIENMLRAGDSCIPYAHPDCGGHLGNPSEELYLRWMQFGALCPIHRPHAAKTVERFREPWQYGERALEIARDYIRLRYRLLPLIYAGAHNAYETGEPIFKRLGYNYPNDKRALKANHEYMLGNDLLIVPVFGKRMKTVEQKRYASPVKATYFSGHDCAGAPLATAVYKDIDFNWTNVPPHKGVPAYDFSARFETELYFDEDVRLIAYVDDGVTVFVDGEKVMENREMKSGRNLEVCLLKGGVKHGIKLDYFQAGASACMALRYEIAGAEANVEEVYLPEGKWLHAFTGRTYTGGRTYRIRYGLRDMPLFVRMGATLPLAYEAKNTREQKWNRLVYDLYPCKEATDEGALYEDDTYSTAYKYGGYRTSGYRTYYDESRNAFVAVFEKSEGEFAGEKCFLSREIVLRYHLFKGVDKVRKVCVDGNEVAFTRVRKDKEAFPLKAGAAADSDVLLVSFEKDVKKTTRIEIFLQ